MEENEDENKTDRIFIFFFFLSAHHNSLSRQSFSSTHRPTLTFVSFGARAKSKSAGGK